MSKKLLSAFTAFVMSMSLAASVSAECDGFYMGVRGGIVNHNVGDSDEALGDRLEVDRQCLDGRRRSRLPLYLFPRRARIYLA